MKILICGDRYWSNRDMIAATMHGLRAVYGNYTLIEGEAPGADTIARETAEVMRLPVAKFPADWTTYGKAAGPKRNKQMLDAGPDLVVAFHDTLETSRGTGHMVRIAREKGVPVWRLGTFISKAGNSGLKPSPGSSS